MVRLVSIEGNIASGKSTLLASIRANPPDGLSVVFVDEPVQQWEAIKDAQGKGMLSKYYADPKRYAFAFQMMAYISRLSLIRQAIAQGPDVVVTERSMLTDRHVFAQLLAEDGLLEPVEAQIYQMWFNEFMKDIPEPEVIYVRTSPRTCVDRAAKRGRPGEAVTPAYLASVHAKHEAWLVDSEQSRVLVLNADQDAGRSPAAALAWHAECINFIARPGPPAPSPCAPSCGGEEGWKLQFDGASRGNPGHSSAGWAVFYNGGLVEASSHYLSPSGTNNWAEYEALLGALKSARNLGARDVVAEGDSKLVVEQVSGRWETKAKNLIGLRDQCAAEIQRIPGGVTLNHIPRVANALADSLANKAIDDHLKQSAGGGR